MKRTQIFIVLMLGTLAAYACDFKAGSISNISEIFVGNLFGDVPNSKVPIHCYTLQGVRTIDDVKSLAPDIYIVNGKKVIVK